VIDAAADQLVKQVGTIPQALDRYVHLIQSLNQSEQIALQAISSDTKNILSMATEKFDTLVTDTAAVKKFYPILDKKFEKQLAEFESLRKAHAQTDQDLEDVQKTLVSTQKDLEATRRDIKDSMGTIEQQTMTNFASSQAAIQAVQDSVKGIVADDLPGFRRELTNVIGTKFEFMESTQNERQAALRAELVGRLDGEKKSHGRVQILLGLLVVLSIVLQLAFHFTGGKGVTP
jgi:chromosome segregation ATPase